MGHSAHRLMALMDRQVYSNERTTFISSQNLFALVLTTDVFKNMLVTVVVLVGLSYFVFQTFIFLSTVDGLLYIDFIFLLFQNYISISRCFLLNCMFNFLSNQLKKTICACN